jgi:antitoxin component YwqK of YwqJK toxin-antitoxin module
MYEVFPPMCTSCILRIRYPDNNCHLCCVFTWSRKSVSMKLLLVFLLTSLLTWGCYPKRKVLVRFADGRPKVIRHYKRNDTLNEKLVSYYENGKVEYIKYWRGDWCRYIDNEWYPNGKKSRVSYEKYKDTVRSFDTKDSVVRIKGYLLRYTMQWYDNGKPSLQDFVKDGKECILNFNRNGDTTYKQYLPVRFDGYRPYDTYMTLGGKNKARALFH